MNDLKDSTPFEVTNFLQTLNPRVRFIDKLD